MENVASAGGSTAPNSPPDTVLPDPDRFIGESECKRLTDLSRVSRWRLEKVGQFPRRRQISPNRIGWLLSEILAWQREREAA